MKKFLCVSAVLLLLCSSACSQQDGPSDAGESAGNRPPETIEMLDEGTWPANAYTEGLPVPPGTVDWAMLDTARGNCSVSLTGLSEADCGDYLSRLQQAGFSVIEEVSEQIAGQDYVSIGNLLSDGEKWLSVSYVPGRLTLYIAFDDPEADATP